MSKRNPVEHFKDGRNAWKKEAYGLVRYRGYFASIAATGILGGAPWWWPTDLGQFTIRGDILLTTIIVIIGLFFLYALHYLRVRSMRSLNMKHQLHMVSHEIRDKYIEIHKDDNFNDINQLTHNLCDLIQRYFTILTNEKEHIGVAIRIAQKSEKGTIYKTFGRSCLNKHREENSKPLMSNEGVARILQNDKGRKGMLIYNDLPAAIEAGAYVEHPNDREFPDDIITMMVAPINGWDGEKKGMLGILYVTSNKLNIFGEKHTDSMGFVSDALSNIYSELVVGCPSNNKGKQHELF